MKNSWLIGRGSQCDLVVNNGQVSVEHCRLERHGDSFTLVDLESTNGIYINGERMGPRAAITDADTILLAEIEPMPWPKELQGERDSPDASCPTPTIAAPEGSVQKFTIGRNPSSDVVIDVECVSWDHARLIVIHGNFWLEDLQSSNGTFIGNQGRRIAKEQFDDNDTIWFGTHKLRGRWLKGCCGIDVREFPSNRTSNREFNQDTDGPTVLGRDPKCDRPLSSPLVSWHHARIIPQDSSFLVEDLKSTNGTYVNGELISEVRRCNPGDVVSLGTFEITLAKAGGILANDHRDKLSIEAKDVVIQVPGRILVDQVSLTIQPGEFVGLMGPSGAGKSTFMNALNGYMAPIKGQVLIGGKDLYLRYDELRGQIGYVPQDDVMHAELTVYQALYYTARLRFSSDFDDQEIHKRIERLLEQLGLQGTEDVLIGSPEKKGISGGQRKRVNLAMELLTDPSILFLDEPTSGLSSEDALSVMRTLRGLADEGKTILLTIHQPSLEAFRLMDNLVLIAKDANSPEPGRLAYYGPAYPDAVYFFNPDGVPNLKPGSEPSPDNVLRGLAKERCNVWEERYRTSIYQSKFVTNRKSPPIEKRQVARAKRRFSLGIHQGLTLLRRTWTIKLKDRANTLLLLVQAPLIACLIVMVFGEKASQDATQENFVEVNTAMASSIFLLALSALWCGCSNAVREVVSEWPVYRRERMVNLRIPSYIASKLGVLFAFSTIQCFILLGTVHAFNGMKGPWFDLYVVLLLSSMVGTTIGLAISAIAKTSEFAIGMLPVVILPMVMLGGVMQHIHKMSDTVQTVTKINPSRWAFESLLLIESEKHESFLAPLQGSDFEAPTKHQEMIPIDLAEPFFPKSKTRTSAQEGFMTLLSMLLTFLGIVALVLRKRDLH